MRIGVVGAGINGLWLAWRLAEKGNDVTVFETKNNVGKEVCSGLVSERIWDFIPRRSDLVKNAIRKGRVHFPKKTIDLSFSPRMLVLEHAELDRYVADLALKAGVKMLLGHRCMRIFQQKSGSRPQITVSGRDENRTYEFDLIIGSDGPHSTIRKQLGLKDPKFRLGMFCYVGRKSSSDVIDVYPHKHGFSWIIPRGDSIEYGTLEEPSVAKKHFDAFCASNKIKPKNILSATIPHGLVNASIGKVALVGDSIGLTKSWSWGGIVWGLTASDLLLDSFPNFSSYSKKVEQRFGPRMFFSDIATSVAFWLGFHVPFILPKNIIMDSDWVFE